MKFVNEYIAVGVILKPYRQNGYMLAEIDQVFLKDLIETKAVFLKLDGLHVPFFVESLKPDEESCLIKLEEINAPEIVKKHNGEQIFLHVSDVGEESLEKQKHGTLDYITGYTLVDNATGRSYRIITVEEYPQQLMATVDVDGNSVLIPLVDEWISKIDDKSQSVFMDLPDGLI